MRTLLVFPEPPLPEGGASGRCALALIDGLRGHGVDLQVIAARQEWAVRGDPPDRLGVEVVDVAPEPPGLQPRLLSLTRPLGGLARSELAVRVREAAREADVIHLEEISTARLGDGLAVPVVTNLHYLVRRDRAFGAPWRRDFRHVLELARAERWAIRSNRFLLASSPLVADELRRRARRGTEIVLAPLSLDPRDYPAAPLDGPPVAGVIGNAAWPPTAAGIRRLVSDVWPRVRRLAPTARLLVAGRGTASLVEEAEGVQALGEVPSAGEFLRGLALVLYPLERGSGMKVKVLEAIASGVPVVTTPSGAEGIIAEDGMVVETDLERMALAAASILLDEGERRERGAAARRAFERAYTPLPATRPVADLYERMV
ncbi:MAG: glycosyltransferase family 4 protein [Actinomycetota bacterium]